MKIRQIVSSFLCGVCLLVASANAQVTIDSLQDAAWDGYIHLYAGSFDPTNQLANLVAGDDDGPGGIGTSQLLNLALAPGEYVLVTSGFAAADCGTYTNTISGSPGALPSVLSGDTCGGPLWDRPVGAGPSISGLGPVEYSADSFSIVPEPASGLLLLCGLMGVLRLRRS